MQISIDQVRNGFIVKTEEGVYVFESTDSDNANLLSMLRFLDALLGKYDKFGKEETRLILAPGHKSPLWESIECPLCSRPANSHRDLPETSQGNLT
jgi:hypothetical protein